MKYTLRSLALAAAATVAVVVLYPLSVRVAVAIVLGHTILQVVNVWDVLATKGGDDAGPGGKG